MNSTVAILEQIVELFKQTTNNQEISNQLKELNSKIDDVIKRIDSIQNTGLNPNPNPGETQRVSDGDDPGERTNCQAIDANISTEIQMGTFGLLDMRKLAEYQGDRTVEKIIIQSGSLREVTETFTIEPPSIALDNISNDGNSAFAIEYIHPAGSEPFPNYIRLKASSTEILPYRTFTFQYKILCQSDGKWSDYRDAKVKVNITPAL